MNLPFKGGYRITQEFGVNASYYKQFGLKAHEGIDLAPKDSDWNVECLADGVIVRDEDNPRSGAYGIYVTVWHPQLNRATQYCHLEKNFVELNQEVKQGQPLGNMGSTGNSTGPHLHLNLFETDGEGIRQNRNNGYLGGINPLPFMENIMALPEPGKVEVDAKVFEELVTKSTKYDGFKAIGYEDAKDVTAKVAKFENDIRGYEETNRNLNTLLSEKSKRISVIDSELSTSKARVLELEAREKSLIEQAKKAQVNIKEYEYLVEQREVWIKSEKNLEKRIKNLEVENDLLRKNSFKALIVHWANNFKNWWKR